MFGSRDIPNSRWSILGHMVISTHQLWGQISLEIKKLSSIFFLQFVAYRLLFVTALCFDLAAIVVTGLARWLLLCNLLLFVTLGLVICHPSIFGVKFVDSIGPAKATSLAFCNFILQCSTIVTCCCTSVCT